MADQQLKFYKDLIAIKQNTNSSSKPKSNPCLTFLGGEVAKSSDKGATGDRKGDQKKTSERSTEVKRVNIPPTAKMLLGLDIPFEMMDPTMYLDYTKKVLQEYQDVAKSHKLKDLESNVESALKKCSNLQGKDRDELGKRKKEKEYTDDEVLKILRSSDPLHQLADFDLKKIKSQTLRDNLSMVMNRLSQEGKLQVEPKKDEKWKPKYSWQSTNSKCIIFKDED